MRSWASPRRASTATASPWLAAPSGRRAGTWVATSRSSGERSARSCSSRPRCTSTCGRHGPAAPSSTCAALFHVHGRGLPQPAPPRGRGRGVRDRGAAARPLHLHRHPAPRRPRRRRVAMYAEYNMGAGFCAVVPEAEAERAIAAGSEALWHRGVAAGEADGHRLSRTRGRDPCRRHPNLRGGAEGFGAASRTCSSVPSLVVLAGSCEAPRREFGEER